MSLVWLAGVHDRPVTDPLPRRVPAAPGPALHDVPTTAMPVVQRAVDPTSSTAADDAAAAAAAPPISAWFTPAAPAPAPEPPPVPLDALVPDPDVLRAAADELRDRPRWLTPEQANDVADFLDRWATG